MSNIDFSQIVTAAQAEVNAQDVLRKAATAERDKLLSETDWMALSDTKMSKPWATYRQALRDITKQKGFPSDVTWPVRPDA